MRLDHVRTGRRPAALVIQFRDVGGDYLRRLSRRNETTILHGPSLSVHARQPSAPSFGPSSSTRGASGARLMVSRPAYTSSRPSVANISSYSQLWVAIRRTKCTQLPRTQRGAAPGPRPPQALYGITAILRQIEEHLDIARRATTISRVGEYHTQDIVVLGSTFGDGMSR